jgi:AraC-like DNA-binding protein
MALTPSDDLSRSWLLTLSGRWQCAAGLRADATVADVATAIESLFVPIPGWDQLPDALLLRGWVLELAVGLRVAARRLPPRVRPSVLGFSEQLCATPRITPQLRQLARALIYELRGNAAVGNPMLAHSVKAYLDEHLPGTVDLDALSRAHGMRPRALARAFRSEFGRTVVQYCRRRRVDLAIGILAGAVPAKQVAYDIGCGQATLRRLVHRATGRAPREITRGLSTR